eukprot:scaffold88465_cov23-Tisochrysis_lutea.AAC.1
MQRSCWGKDGKAYIAVPAHEGCSAGAKKVPGTQEALLKGWGSSAGAHPHPCIMCGVGKQTMLFAASLPEADMQACHDAHIHLTYLIESLSTAPGREVTGPQVIALTHRLWGLQEKPSIKTHDCKVAAKNGYKGNFSQV